MTNLKILYLMHVPWAWIKQRPHYFAEFLNESFDISVVYKRPLTVSSSHLMDNKTSLSSISSYLMIPYQRLPVIRNMKLLFKNLNRFLFLKQIKIDGFNIIWITSLSIYSLIEKDIPNNVVLIFDCMDDELEFPEVKANLSFAKELKENERKLMARANVVLCSSDFLKNVVLERTISKRDDILVINNAVSLPSKFPVSEKYQVISHLDNIIMYVGAISSWFDFTTVLYALEQNPTANIVLVGPADVEIPQMDRLIHLGTVQREYIFSLMEKADILIMPFVVNNLIKSVNPVKIYEYIYMKKTIIVPLYGETEKFEGHVYFYRDKFEFSELIRECINGNIKYPLSEQENIEFINKNTWKSRYLQLEKVIKEAQFN